MKNIKEFITNNKLVTVSLLAIILSVALKAPFICFFLSIILCSLSIKLPGPLATSGLARLVTSILVILTLFQVETTLFYLVSFVVHPLTINIITLIFITYFAYRNKIQFSDIKSLSITKYDTVALIAPIILISVIVLGIMNPSRGMGTSVLSSFLYASDNGAHIEMFSLNARNDGNLFKTDYAFVRDNAEFAYPMGWHNATAIVFKSFVTNIDNAPFMYIVYGYFAAFMSTLFLTLICLSLFILYFYRKYSKKDSIAVTALVLPMVNLIIGFLVLFPLYKMGFFNFLPIILYTLLPSTILLCVSSKKDLFSTTLLLLLFSCGVCSSWLLPFPIYLLFAGVITVYFLVNKMIKQAAQIGLAMIMALVIGGILTYKSMSGGISTDSLSAGGGLPQTFDEMFIIVAFIFAIVYLSKSKIIEKEKLNPFPIFLFCIIAGLAALRLYFLIKGFGLGYYYTKFSYVAIVVCSSIFLVSIVFAMEKNSHTSFLVTMMAIFLIGTYGKNYDSMLHWMKYINTSQYLSGSVSNAILTEFSRPYNIESQYLYPVYNGEPGVAEIFLRIVNINKYKNNTQCIEGMTGARGSVSNATKFLEENKCPGKILMLN